VISDAFKTSLETRLQICMHKASQRYRLEDYIGFTPSCFK